MLYGVDNLCKARDLSFCITAYSVCISTKQYVWFAVDADVGSDPICPQNIEKIIVLVHVSSRESI